MNLLGEYKNTYISYSLDEEIRKAGQSGGLVSSLLIYALDKNLIDGAIVTRWKKDNPLEPEMFLAKTKDEILQAARSKYCYVPMFKEIKNIKGKIAFVGLPCQIHEIKKLENPNVKIIYHFGLFCDRILTSGFFDYILSKAKVKRDDVAKFTYRAKEWRGSPGDVEIILKDGTVKNIHRKHRMRVKSLFTPYYCLDCKDKANKLSDITFGDAWLPECRKDKLGTLIIISRTDIGDNLLNEAKDENIIRLDEIEPYKVVVAQKLDKRKT